MSATTTDLSTQSPREIDTALAEIYGRLYRVYDLINQKTRFIKDYTAGLEKKAKGDTRYLYWSEEERDNLVSEREALREEALTIRLETSPYEAEFTRRGGWSRFFLVQNNGGHIHSSMSCSTCYPTTRFGWLPDLSGQTEPEAVAAHGAILCTVCYPSAPSEWTDRRDDSKCDGGGRYYDSSLPHRAGFYTGNWAECPVCHTNQTLLKSGKIRKHKKESN